MLKSKSFIRAQKDDFASGWSLPALIVRRRLLYAKETVKPRCQAPLHGGQCNQSRARSAEIRRPKEARIPKSESTAARSIAEAIRASPFRISGFGLPSVLGLRGFGFEPGLPELRAALSRWWLRKCVSVTPPAQWPSAELLSRGGRSGHADRASIRAASSRPGRHSHHIDTEPAPGRVHSGPGCGP